MFGIAWTTAIKASLPLMGLHGVSLVAPVSGAQLMCTPTDPLIFNIRARCAEEVERLIGHRERYQRNDLAVMDRGATALGKLA